MIPLFQFTGSVIEQPLDMFLSTGGAGARQGGSALTILKAVQEIVNPIIIIFFLLALSVFVYGVFEFIRGSDNDEARTKGQKHMLWGVIGLFIMTATFAIIRFLISFVSDFGSSPGIWILG